MMLENDVTPFEASILRNVIDLYIETGKPVSSRTLKTKYRLIGSTANIRKILHLLEGKGYLFKPHISAGRIPSDRGYRCYVDGMTSIKPLGRKVVEEVRKKIGQEWGDIRDVMYRTSRLLGEMTSCMGLMMSIFHSYGDVERIRIIPLEGKTALVVLSMSQGDDRKVIIEFPGRYRNHVIDRAVQIINERIAGYPLEEAHQRLEIFIRETDGVEREITEGIASEADYLFDRPYDLQYHFDGFGDSSETNEMKDPKRLRSLVKIMGERSLMLSFMKNRINDEVMITIGSENFLEELEGFSVITRRFAASSCDGVFGVLGPTRMSYGLVLSLLSMMGQELQSRKGKS